VIHTTHYNAIKTRVHEIFDDPDKNDPIAHHIQKILALVVLVNTLAIILLTVPAISVSYDFFLSPLINLCLLVFTIEYALRMWSCSFAPDVLGKVTERIRYGLHLYLLVDFFSIAPFLFPFFFPQHLALLRLLRMVSIFKLGRYSRYSESLEQLKRVLFRKKEVFVIMLFFLVFVVLFSSTIMYLVENPAQPDKFSSIPAAMWWSMMTVTTVGYGDIVPITPLGKLLGSVITLAGVLVLALPSAILATGFIEEREKAKTDDPYHEMDRIHTDLIGYFNGLHDQGRITDQEYTDLTGKITRLKEGNR
jgi:voltage-gated potassium channel